MKRPKEALRRTSAAFPTSDQAVAGWFSAQSTLSKQCDLDTLSAYWDATSTLLAVFAEGIKANPWAWRAFTHFLQELRTLAVATR